MRPPPIAAAVLGAVAVATVLLVVASLDRPAPLEYAVTTPRPEEAGDSLIGPAVYTVDASSPDRWVFFDFSRGSVVSAPGPTDWDLAFNRFTVIANGGSGFAGQGGAQDLGEVPFDSVSSLPATGYTGTVARRDSTHAVLGDWYDYSFTSHLLTPLPRAFAIRTADGRYVLLRFLGYYCAGANPGCVTFEYLYQGGEGRSVARGVPDGPSGGSPP